LSFENLIIDGNNFAWRAGSVLFLSNEAGKNVSIAFGMLKMIRSLLEEYNPKKIIVCWDRGGSTAKKEIYPEYKQNRKSKSLPEEFYKEIISQISEIQKILPHFGIKQLVRYGIEADDLIGVLCRDLKEKALVVSSDKDLLQCVEFGSSMLHTSKNKLVDRTNFFDYTGVSPELFVYYKTILGDSGDNIFGLSGFGEVTAKKLVNTFGSWENWYVNGQIIPQVLTSLRKNQKFIATQPDTLPILERNYKLMNIGCLIEKDKDELLNEVFSQRSKVSEEEIRKCFLDNQFESLLGKFHSWMHVFRQLANYP